MFLRNGVNDMSSFSDASISFSDISSNSEIGNIPTRMRETGNSKLRPQQKNSQSKSQHSSLPMQRHAPDPVKKRRDHESSPSISFDESMLGDSGDISITRRPPLSSAGRAVGAMAQRRVGERPKLPAKAPQPKSRQTEDSFSLSGSLDFSDDLEIHDSKTAASKMRHPVKTNAMKSKTMSEDGESFDISGDLSFSGDSLDMDQHTSAPRRDTSKSIPYTTTPSSKVVHNTQAHQRGSGTAVSKIIDHTAVRRRSGGSVSIDMDQVSFGSSESVGRIDAGRHGNNRHPPSYHPPGSRKLHSGSRPSPQHSVDTDDIHFSGDDDDDDGSQSSSNRRQTASASGGRRPAFAPNRPETALGVRVTMSRTPSISGERGFES